MVILFIIMFFVFLFLKIFFSIKKNLKLKYIFTPLVTLILVLMPLYFLYYNNNKYAVLITAGLIFSLIGDIFNMLEPPEYNFVNIGGFFFLCAHAFYVPAFLRKIHFNFQDLLLIIFLLIFISVFFIIYIKKAGTLFLKAGILIYITAVSFSLYASLSGLMYFHDLKSLITFTGMLLFWISDLILIHHLLIKKVKLESLIVWGLYAPGQLLITLSVFF